MFFSYVLPTVALGFGIVTASNSLGVAMTFAKLQTFMGLVTSLRGLGRTMRSLTVNRGDLMEVSLVIMGEEYWLSSDSGTGV